MASCLICEKTTILGRSHTHHRGVAGGRWKKRAQKTNRLFKANIQNVTIIYNGDHLSAKLCTKCIKRARKDVADGVRPIVQLVGLVGKTVVADSESVAEGMPVAA